MVKRFSKFLCLMFAVLLLAGALSSCTPQLSDIYYADSNNMLIFSGDSGGLLENGLTGATESGKPVIAITMGVTEQGTYTISGDKITFKFGDVTSSATYDKKKDTITWYGLTYVKPQAATTAVR